jgi:hypothetical protein
MVQVDVAPQEFTVVRYDAATIAAVTATVAERIGFPAGVRVRIEVDEMSPLGRTSVTQPEPDTVVVAAEGGAFEDPQRVRQLSEQAVRDVMSRVLLRQMDRMDPAFGAPPADADLDLQHQVAWDAYALGRAERRRLVSQQDRRRYHFRIRHGFNDVADSEFTRLWAAERLTWNDIEQACLRTAAGSAVSSH